MRNRTKALSFSFISYVVVLFAIIVVDTFARKDFVFERALTIAALYMIALFTYFTLFFLVLRDRGSMVNLIKYWSPVCIYIGVIFYLSSISGLGFISRLDEMDPRKFSLHILEYGGLGFLLYLALSNSRFVYKGALILTLLLGLTFGVFDELYQSQIPGRRFNPYDIASDEVGIIVGSIIARIKGSRRRNK